MNSCHGAQECPEYDPHEGACWCLLRWLERRQIERNRTTPGRT